MRGRQLAVALAALVALTGGAVGERGDLDQGHEARGGVVSAGVMGDATSTCAQAACVAFSGTGDARADCGVATVCVAASAMGDAASSCAVGTCAAASGLGGAAAECAGRCAAVTPAVGTYCFSGGTCAHLDSSPGVRSCLAWPRCLDAQTSRDAQGDAAVSLLGDARGDVVAASGTGGAEARLVAASAAGHATGGWYACSPPPETTSVCAAPVAVSGTGNASADDRCDAAFCAGRVGVSATGPAHGHVAVSLLGSAEGGVAWSLVETLDDARLRPRPLDGPTVPALP